MNTITSGVICKGSPGRMQRTAKATQGVARQKVKCHKCNKRFSFMGIKKHERACRGTND